MKVKLSSVQILAKIFATVLGMHLSELQERDGCRETLEQVLERSLEDKSHWHSLGHFQIRLTEAFEI